MGMFDDLIPQQQGGPNIRYIPGPPLPADEEEKRRRAALIQGNQAAASVNDPAKSRAESIQAQAQAAYARQQAEANAANAAANAANARNQPRNMAFDNEGNFRKEFTARPEVASFGTIAQQYASALRAAKINNKAADLDLVNAYAKILDPGSVVREGEVTMAGNVGGAAEQMKGYMQSLSGEGRLTASQRQEIIGQVRNRASHAADAYRLQREHYSQLAQQYGIDPGHIVGPNPAQPYQQEEADFFGKPVKNGSSFVYPHGKGPLDPTGSGDIGFNNGGAAAALPPHAQEAQRAIQEAIANGQLRTPEAIVGFAKSKFGLDIDPKQAAAAAAQIAKGGMPNVNTPQYQPDISVNRGKGGIEDRAKAFFRGAADTSTLGLADEGLAAFRTMTHGGPMSANLAHERAIDDYDSQNHGWMRGLGQVAGGFALPMGEMNGAMDLAKAAGGYGAAYGVGSGRGSLGDRLENGVYGGIAGAATGGALGLGGQMFGKGINAMRPRQGEMPPLVNPQTGVLNQPLESVSPAQRMAAAQQYGIHLPLGAATDRGGAIIEKGLDVLPMSAGMMNDTRRTLGGEVQNALGNVAGRYGTADSLYTGGQALQRGAKSWIERAQGVRGDPQSTGVVGKVYDAIPIHPNRPAEVNATRNALTGMLDVFKSNPEMQDIFQNGQLRRYMQALTPGAESVVSGPLQSSGATRDLMSIPRKSGLSWDDLKHFRSIVGEQIGSQRFSEDPRTSQLRALYGALSEDMRSTASREGPHALRAFERANNVNRGVESRIETALTRILGDDARNNPEAASAAIHTIATSGRGSSNIEQLRGIRASMMKGGEWNEVASSLINMMGRPAKAEGREFNPQTFVDGYAGMTEPARNLLFGDGGRAELRKALDGFVAINQRLAGTNALRNTSNTVPGFLGAGAVTSAASAISHPSTLLAIAGTGAANYGIAKLWTNPSFVRWATGYTKLAASGNARAAQAQVGRLRQIAARNPSLQGAVESLQQRLLQGVNDNMGYGVAASGGNEQEQPNY